MGYEVWYIEVHIYICTYIYIGHPSRETTIYLTPNYELCSTKAVFPKSLRNDREVAATHRASSSIEFFHCCMCTAALGFAKAA